MRKVSWRKKWSSLGTFLLVSVLAGLLVAGLAIPGAALAGVMSTTMYSSLTQLPIELETPPQAERTSIYLGDGSLLTQVYDENRVIVTLDQIAPVMQQAQIAIEDDRFYSHGALDFKSLAKAVLTNLGGDGGGGSTLTQQYVKQVLVEAAAQKPTAEEQAAALEEAQGRTIARKVREMRYAIALEQKFSKDQILENYLNIAYYGNQTYGVEAAAHYYYNTSAANLTLGQAAMLAGIVQIPSRNPIEDLPGATDRRNVVLGRMLELGVITQAQANEAKAEVFDPNQIQNPQNGCVFVSYQYVQICQYVITTLKKNTNLGATEEERYENLRRGGYDVYTTIDPVKQTAVQDSILNRIAANDPVKSAMVIMEPGTGKVLAAAQNRWGYALGDDSDESNDANYYAGKTAVQYFAQYDYGIDEGAQAGSTFKSYVVAAALDQGISPKTTLNAAQRIDFKGQDFKGCSGPAIPNNGGSWAVSNSGGTGVIDMYHGAANSVNTYFVQLEKLVGLCNVVTMATKVGAQSNPKDPDHKTIMDFGNDSPSFTLGVADTSPMAMAVSFSTYAGRGMKCDPVVVAEIKDRDGNNIPTTNGNCTQAIRPEVADGVNAVLGNAYTYGTASGYPISGHTLSGKTGTTENGSAAWIVGYTPQLVAVTMVAVDKNRAWSSFWDPRKPAPDQPPSMGGVAVHDGDFRLSGFGAQDAGPIFQPAMTIALQDLPNVAFTAPSSEIVNGKPVNPPSTSGMDLNTAQKTLQDAGFNVTVTQTYDNSPAGTFLGASCPQHVYGGVCTLSVSQGPRPPEPIVPPVITTPSSTATGGTGG